jgi:hypothetical protein
MKILPPVYGCVTKNNAFWIGRLDLFKASFTTTRNHNQLQLTIRQQNPSSLTAEDSVHSRSRSTTPSVVLRCIPILLVFFPFIFSPFYNHGTDHAAQKTLL